MCLYANLADLKYAKCYFLNYTFHMWNIWKSHVPILLIIHNTALEPCDLEKRVRSVCLWVHDRALIHQNTIVPASTVAPLSRLVAKWQNADWTTVWFFSLYSFFGGKHARSHRAQEAHSVHEWEEAFIKGQEWTWGTIWPTFDRRGEVKRSNKHHTHIDTNRHAVLEPHHPTSFQFPVNGYNSICLQAV